MFMQLLLVTSPRSTKGSVSRRILLFSLVPLSILLFLAVLLFSRSAFPQNNPLAVVEDISVEGADQLTLRNRNITWKLFNATAEPVVLQSINVSWPDSYGDLEQIKLAGSIYKGSHPAPSTSIGSNQLLREQNRTIRPGKSNNLRFEFSERHSGATQDDVSITATFNDGSVVTFGNNVPEPPVPEPTLCMVSGAQDLIIGDRYVKWELFNGGAEPVVLEKASFMWPSEYGDLTEIKLAGRIYRGLMPPPFGEVMGGWGGREINRTIKPGKTLRLEAKFAERYKDALQENFNISASFSGDCGVVFGDGGEPPIEDTTPPMITLLGDNPLEITIGDTYTDPGVAAMDDVDGDLSDKVLVGGDVVDNSTIGIYFITYDVMDSTGNAANQITREVRVEENSDIDTTPPVITLLEDNPLEVPFGEEFVDPGATAIDEVDGDLTDSIMAGGDFVDESIPGDYNITYDVADAAGNEAIQVMRTVVISAAQESAVPNGVVSSVPIEDESQPIDGSYQGILANPIEGLALYLLVSETENVNDFQVVANNSVTDGDRSAAVGETFFGFDVTPDLPIVVVLESNLNIGEIVACSKELGTCKYVVYDKPSENIYEFDAHRLFFYAFLVEED